MSYRWELRPMPPTYSPELAHRVGKYAAKILALRDLCNQVDAFLDPDHYLPSSPFDLPDMERAVQRLVKAREQAEPVLIWGDFDCDGVTSTALLLTAMRSLGFDVDFTIPLRSEEGHGLNLGRLERILSDNQVGVIITVDCGVSNQAEIEQAQAQGVDVIVSDHHLLPTPLPAALAVINPLRLDPEHPLRVLPGVGVAYKVAEALFETLGQPQAGILSYLDLATVGIVADVAVLQRECRYLVQRGLPVLSHTPRQGLKHLIETVMEGPLTSDLTATDVAFKLAPKLNAIGRLDDARLAVELLTTVDSERAGALVDQFLATNQERKSLTEIVVQEARQQVERQNLADKGGIVLAQAGWHGGVLGIAAARLAETYGCPAVLLGIGAQEAAGSGRSVPTVDLAAALDAVDPLLLSHGGHPMAAGLRVSLQQLSALQVALTQELGSRLASGDATRTLVIELALDPNLLEHQTLEDAVTEIFEQLQPLEPFGHGHPRPVIALLNLPNHRNQGRQTTLGLSRNGEHLAIQVGSRRLWWWRQGDRLAELDRHDRLDVAFVVEPTDFQNQIWRGVIQDIRPAGSQTLTPIIGIRFQIKDQRQHPPADPASNQPESPDPQVVIFNGCDLHWPRAKILHLQAWPSTPSSLQTLLHQVQPRQMVLMPQLVPIQIPVSDWIPALVSLRQTTLQQQTWQESSILRLGIPLDLAQALIRATPLPLKGSESVPVWLTLLQEARAFQNWIQTASRSDLENLCKRLLRTPTQSRDPRPAIRA